MEVKVNKDIQQYRENMFFGLTLRQFFFSLLGCGFAVLLYFLCKGALGLELTTWVCVLGVLPFAALGFLKYNGMPAEKVFLAWFRTRFLNPGRYLCEPVSYYYELLEESIEIRQGSLCKKDLKKIRKREKRLAKARKKKERKK